MEIDEFAKTDLTKEDQDEIRPVIVLRMSNRLRDSCPHNVIRIYYIRRAIEILHLIRNSPCRSEILSHLGYDADLNLDYNRFHTNYTKEYLINILNGNTKQLSIVEPKQNTNSLNDQTKTDIQTMIQLFKKALDIDAFVGLVTEEQANAVSRLEGI